MSDFILINGDEAIFNPNFGAAVVAMRPGILQGSGPATFGGQKLCVDGDEKRVAVLGCSYITPQYSIPGVGTLKIAALAANQKAKKTQTGGKPVLLLGRKFTAKFEVTAPAKQPPPGPGAPIPDPTSQYSGSGSFITANTRFKGV